MYKSFYCKNALYKEQFCKYLIMIKLISRLTLTTSIQAQSAACRAAGEWLSLLLR